MRMRVLAEVGVMGRYPMIFKISPGDPTWSAEVFEVQRHELLEDVLMSRLDPSLGNLLRQAEFRRLYFAELPAELETVPKQEMLSLLREIKRHMNGAFVIGDVAYLKLANNIGRAHGDRLLELVAKALELTKLSLIARFREGDEVACWVRDVKVVHTACEEVNQYLSKSGFTVGGLPPRVDFGVVTHTEVCDVLISLLKQGWMVPEGSTLKREFFEIALRIAESRQGVVKIYQRGLLLLELLREQYAPLWRGGLYTFYQQRAGYQTLFSSLMRGGKFVQPRVSWLALGKESVELLLMRHTLELIRESIEDDEVGKTVYRKAMAIYV